MAVLEVEESDKYPVFPEGTEVNVKVMGVKQQDSFFDVDKNDPSKGKQKELSFRFKITDPEYAHLDDVLWGSVSPPAPKVGNRSYLWMCALFGVEELAIGFAIDTDDLIGQEATATLQQWTSKKGTVGNSVSALYSQSAAPKAPVAEQGSATPAALTKPFAVEATNFEEPF